MYYQFSMTLTFTSSDLTNYRPKILGKTVHVYLTRGSFFLCQNPQSNLAEWLFPSIPIALGILSNPEIIWNKQDGACPLHADIIWCKRFVCASADLVISEQFRNQCFRFWQCKPSTNYNINNIDYTTRPLSHKDCIRLFAPNPQSLFFQCFNDSGLTFVTMVPVAVSMTLNVW